MEDFKPFQDKVQSALLSATRSVNTLANEDLSFQRTVNPSVRNDLDDKTARLLSLSNDLLKSAGGSRGAVSLEDMDDVDMSWKSIVDTIDSLLEKADTCLDEYTGLIKRKDAPTSETVRLSTAEMCARMHRLTRSLQGRAIKKPKPNSGPLDWHLKRANILKPQEAFERKVDNFTDGPWKPILSSKPHAKVPLEDSLQTFEDEEGQLQYEQTCTLSFGHTAQSFGPSPLQARRISRSIR